VISLQLTALPHLRGGGREVRRGGDGRWGGGEGGGESRGPQPDFLATPLPLPAALGHMEVFKSGPRLEKGWTALH